MNNSQNKIEIILSAVDRGLATGLSRVTGNLNALEKVAGVVRNTLVAVLSLNVAGSMQGWISEFARTADAMRDLDQRLLLTAKNTADYVASQQTVIDVARVAHQEIAVVGTLYTRMALATANLSTSQKDLADVTKTVALATALSGSAASESAAGLQQFAQAMSSDRLQGDELRSVLENIPMLAKIFVDAAGGSMAKLREMAEKGELTTQWMVNAIKAAQATIEAQAAAMPPTVGRAMTDLKNEFTIYVDQVNKATGATDIMAASIQWLGQNLDIVAKGGVLALTAALSALAGRGITAAISKSTAFIASLGATATAATTTGAAVSSAAAYMSGSYAPAAATVASTTASRLLPALASLINPITAITTVLGIGAAAWMMWGRSADDELSKAKGRLAELKRTNQMLKELSDPGVRLENTAKNIEAAKAEVAALETDLAKAVSEPSNIPFDNTIGVTAEQLDKTKQKLEVLEQEHAETQKNIEITTQQRGAKEVAVEMTVTDAIKKQDEERRKITASKLENAIAEIEKDRQAELKSIEAKFQGEDKLRVQAAINARFDAAAAKAKDDAADKSAKKADAAARKAEAEAKRKEREMLKDERLQERIDTEKLRALSEQNLLELEREKLAAENGGTELEQAEKLLEINRRISAEKIRLQVDEAKRIKADPARTEADIIKAESEVTKAKIEALRQEHSDLAAVARASLSQVEQAWRRGQMSVEQYRAAVQAAGEAGVLTASEVSDRLVAAGDDMGAALSLGFTRAREKMQTDGEVMIQIGEQIGDQIAGGLSSSWSSYITGAESAKEAFIGFARSTIDWLLQIITKQMLLNELQSVGAGFSGGIIPGLAGGGLVQAFAGGGSVRGWSPSKTADNIPAWLTAREFVEPVDSVDYYGADLFELFRRRLIPRHLARALAGDTVPRHIPTGNRLAQGGQAAASAVTTTIKAGDTKLRVINVLDKNMVGDFMRTADGETSIINLIRRNGSTIKALLR